MEALDSAVCGGYEEQKIVQDLNEEIEIPPEDEGQQPVAQDYSFQGYFERLNQHYPPNDQSCALRRKGALELYNMGF